jgi:hypothetical protein
VGRESSAVGEELQWLLEWRLEGAGHGVAGMGRELG